ncbi:MAG: undecaprenyldiphospho-muramoylpentapeptide beta-N-acetylglucosaminyltransferase, partial [Nocardioides sp.]
HTSPLLATADALRRLDATVDIVCLGTARGLETRVVPAAGYALELISPVPLPRALTLELGRVPARLRRAMIETLAVLDSFRPTVVVGYGGYVSLPAYLAARRRKIPIVVHEQNALPGLANKIGARLTDQVAVSFPATPLPHARLVGLPLRRMISTLDREAKRAEARSFFGLASDLPTLLVTGGSQGATRLNQAVADAAEALSRGRVQVLHVSGPRGVADPVVTDVPYVVVPFVDRMDLAYAAADLVLCRAGASSVSEAAAVGLPAVFVPLPIGNGEQRFNAQPIVEVGGATLVDDADLTTAWVADRVVGLITDPARLKIMGTAASTLVSRHADDALAAMIQEVSR